MARILTALIQEVAWQGSQQDDAESNATFDDWESSLKQLIESGAVNQLERPLNMIFAIELDGVGELTVHLALAESSDSLQLTDLKLFRFCTSLMWKNLIKFVAV